MFPGERSYLGAGEWPAAAELHYSFGRSGRVNGGEAVSTTPPYVLAIDIGTSSTRASVYDARGTALPGASSNRRQTVITTCDGGAEMCADDVVERSVRCVEEVLERAGSAAGQVVGVGLCTYWHSILGVGASGRAVTPVYLWSDTRGAPDAEQLRSRVDAQAVHRRTGCPVHASYVA
ncbi:MAG: FGGY family carbohydrate kinase, partial [Armatimonadota bacterium]|nr:FGGY family carbohydrate kinase [Armatimonadota bacterium]